jgi:transcriptional regulator with XRE-family HTH domain
VSEIDEARQRRERRRNTQPVGAFSPPGRRQQTIDRVMARVDAAAEHSHPGVYYAGKVPTPERITIALDFCMLYGPEVDQALGGEEPMVDEWESGERVPSLEQIQALAEMTGYSVRFFYMPPPRPLPRGWLCGSDGCHDLAGKAAT